MSRSRPSCAVLEHNFTFSAGDYWTHNYPAVNARRRLASDKNMRGTTGDRKTSGQPDSRKHDLREEERRARFLARFNTLRVEALPESCRRLFHDLADTADPAWRAAHTLARRRAATEIDRLPFCSGLGEQLLEELAGYLVPRMAAYDFFKSKIEPQQLSHRGREKAALRRRRRAIADVAGSPRQVAELRRIDERLAEIEQELKAEKLWHRFFGPVPGRPGGDSELIDLAAFSVLRVRKAGELQRVRSYRPFAEIYDLPELTVRVSPRTIRQWVDDVTAHDYGPSKKPFPAFASPGAGDIATSKEPEALAPLLQTLSQFFERRRSVQLDAPQRDASFPHFIGHAERFAVNLLSGLEWYGLASSPDNESVDAREWPELARSFLRNFLPNCARLLQESKAAGRRGLRASVGQVRSSRLQRL